jgi:hypothetical protein
MRRSWLLLVAAACQPGAAPVTPLDPAPVGTFDEPPPEEATVEERAARAAADGVLDVHAHLLGRIAERDRTDAARQAHTHALAETWAFERAGMPVPAPLRPDPEVVDAALAALAARDAAGARDRLAPLAQPGAAPALLMLFGRAQLAAGDAVAARRSFARARSRIDAAGGSIGLAAAELAAIDHTTWDRDRLVLLRTRYLRLVGGYQSMEDVTNWIEVVAPGDPDPLVRIPIGSTSGFDTRPPAAVFVDRPYGWTPTEPRLNIVDLRTGERLFGERAHSVHLLRLGTDARSIVVARENRVIVLDLQGVEIAEHEISGKTPGIMRVYTGQGSYHHNVPIEYDSSPTLLEPQADGTIVVGASDGTIWTFGGAQPEVLQPSAGPPKSEHDARGRQVVALERRGDTLTAVHGDGSIVRWRGGRVTEVAPARCNETEMRAGLFDDSRPLTPDDYVECAGAHDATLSPDGSRAILVAGMGRIRVRSAADGRAHGPIESLFDRARACIDPACRQVWLAGVDGRVERWDTDAGKHLADLPQHGVNRFLRGVSPGGRFVVVDDLFEERYKSPSRIRTRVWDAERGAEVEVPRGYDWSMLLPGRAVLASFSRGGSGLLYDLEAGRKLATFATNEGDYLAVSGNGQRLVGFREKKATVRHGDRVVAELEMPGTIYGAALGDEGRRIALWDEHGEVRVHDVDRGAQIYRAENAREAQLSPDGRLVAHEVGGTALVVHDLDADAELGRIAATDLVPGSEHERIRSSFFTGRGAELVFGGPGGPGFTRIYLWRPGEKARPTDLQVLGPDQAVPGAPGVVHVADRNDTIHLLRLDDGRLLASVYAAHGGGWVAQSAHGAVDGPGHGAFVAYTEGLPEPLAFGSWAAWDRLHVPDLLARAGRGELVEPPMPTILRRTQTQAGD